METAFAKVYREWFRTQEVETAARAALSRLDLDTLCPAPSDVFEAYRWARPEEVTAVVVVPHPYSHRSDARGIALQSLDRIPHSAAAVLDNLTKFGHMLREKREALRMGDFRGWLLQAVLLVHAVPVVCPEPHAAAWRDVTAAMLGMLPRRSVALLLGDEARTLASFLPCAHVVSSPSPTSETFQSVDHFGIVNDRLRSLGMEPVDWGSNDLL